MRKDVKWEVAIPALRTKGDDGQQSLLDYKCVWQYYFPSFPTVFSIISRAPCYLGGNMTLYKNSGQECPAYF